MKRWVNVILAMVVMVVCCTAMVLPAYAAEKQPAVSVPVTISLSGPLPNPAETFTVELEADDGAYPMPEGSKSGLYTMTITGADTENFPAITYSRVGIYTYTIYQVEGRNSKCTYDNTVYTLTVCITNAEDGSGLEATAVLYPDVESGKQPGADFENEYEVGPEPTRPSDTPKPGDDFETEDEIKPEPTTPSDTPKTGDESNPVLYVVLVSTSLAVILGLILTGKKKETEE